MVQTNANASTPASANAPSGFELARLWSAAPAFLPHAAGCSCAGHVALHLDAAAVEADVLDYLVTRYERLENRELVAFIAARQVAHGMSFASWLMGLDVAPLAAASRMRLLADLDATVSSLANKSGG